MGHTTWLTAFAKDTLAGLSSSSKYLSSKYFYDDKGSEIFRDIMRMPEYYLTDCELEIFQSHKEEILNEFSEKGSAFELLELGAGDGLKTKLLLSYFLSKHVPFKFTTIDISEKAVNELLNELELELPALNVNGLVGDYFNLINDLKGIDTVKKIVLFLGSNIGNYNEQKALDFLGHLKEVLNPRDQVFIGFDLKKDPEVILKAYDDPYGHTAAFNLNLLHRINSELGANLIPDFFEHHEQYNPQTGTAKSFLISLKNQSVYIRELDKTFVFDKGEMVFMEMSQKYDMDMINRMAEKSGFKIVRNFFDRRQYFVDSLWELKT